MPKGHPLSQHPNRRTAIRLRDMLELNVPLWRISEVLELNERSVYNHYGHIIKEYNRKAGVKPHEPSPEFRSKVRMMASVGITKEEIARFLGITTPTLYKHYRDELDLAAVEANTRVGTNLYLMATGPRTEKSTAIAAIWWSKARMGWKDVSRIENTGADGGPIQQENQVVVVLPDNGRSDVLDLDALEAYQADERDEAASSLPVLDGSVEEGDGGDDGDE